MFRLKKDQKQRVREFVEISGASNNTALEFLKAEGYNLQNALNRFFSADAVHVNNPASGSDKLFERYKSSDAGEDIIDVEGVMELIQDLGIEHTDKALISFAHLCGAENMGEFTRDEFCRGCDQMGVSSVEALAGKLSFLRRRMESSYEFDSIYNFVFMWACPRGKKLLDLTAATQMWELIFTGNQYWLYTERWCEFLHEKHGRPINADTWRQLLQFKKLNGANFDNYDENQAWPVLIDDFVEYIGDGN